MNNTVPNDIKAEQAVIGSILIDSNAIIEILDILEDKDFYNINHQVIFKAMCSIAQRNKTIDIITLSAELKKKDVGGNAYLLECSQSVPSATNILHYADIVQQKATQRRILDAGHKIINLPEQDIDTEEMVEQSQRLVFDASQRKGGNELERLTFSPDPPNETIAISTGFEKLDTKIGGMYKGDMVVLAARPGVGKTALALDIARHASLNNNHRVAIFSFEMKARSIQHRIISAHAGISAWSLRNNRLNKDDKQKVEDARIQLKEAPLYLTDQAVLTTTQMRAMARRLQALEGLDLLIIDYLQLIEPSNHKENKTTQITNISRDLKTIAQELDIPVLVLSQFNREAERSGGMPQLYQLRDSGAIEQDADIVLILHRKKGEEGLLPTTDIFVAKHRNGDGGIINLMFNKNYTSFTEIDTIRNATGINDISIDDIPS